jgi:hypothetical protein
LAEITENWQKSPKNGKNRRNFLTRILLQSHLLIFPDRRLSPSFGENNKKLDVYQNFFTPQKERNKSFLAKTFRLKIIFFIPIPNIAYGITYFHMIISTNVVCTSATSTDN